MKPVILFFLILFSSGCCPPARSLAVVKALPAKKPKKYILKSDKRPTMVRIAVEAEERDLVDVCEEIAQKVGINIWVKPHIAETINLSIYDETWRDVLEVVAEQAECEIREVSPRTFILDQEPRISFACTKDLDIRVVLELIASHAGKNIIIPPEVQGTTSVNIRNVHWRKALDMVAESAGFKVVACD